MLAGDDERTPSGGPAEPGDTALLMLTSGTTSRPKIVPLTHANVCAAAYCSVAAVGLTENDRCINMMPLFHGHGLTNVVLASLAAGPGVVCTPRDDAHRFFALLPGFRPPSYPPVTTIHWTILPHAPNSHQLPTESRF